MGFYAGVDLHARNSYFALVDSAEGPQKGTTRLIGKLQEHARPACRYADSGIKGGHRAKRSCGLASQNVR